MTQSRVEIVPDDAVRGQLERGGLEPPGTLGKLVGIVCLFGLMVPVLPAREGPASLYQLTGRMRSLT